jgi:hypothetical protein
MHLGAPKWNGSWKTISLILLLIMIFNRGTKMLLCGKYKSLIVMLKTEMKAQGILKHQTLHSFVLALLTSLLLSSQVYAQSASERGMHGTAKEEGVVQTKERISSNKKRIALVIGNAAYNINPLKNPVNDAEDIAAKLKEAGFDDVMLHSNVNKKDMENVIDQFAAKLKQTGAVGLFYYAGHGVQSGEVSYLIPLGANIKRKADFKYKGVQVQWILDYMKEVGGSLKIIILDACRDNPFKDRSRGYGSFADGINGLIPPAGSLIAFPASPGQTAKDGKGRNGVYTKHLLKHLLTPGMRIVDLFGTVADEVNTEMEGEQLPVMLNSSLGNKFYFVPTVRDLSPEVEGTFPFIRTERLRQDEVTRLAELNRKFAEDLKRVAGKKPDRLGAGDKREKVRKFQKLLATRLKEANKRKVEGIFSFFGTERLRQEEVTRLAKVNRKFAEELKRVAGKKPDRLGAGDKDDMDGYYLKGFLFILFVAFVAMVYSLIFSNSRSINYELGDRYYYGKGVKLDYKKAMKFYKKAAWQGSWNAKRLVGKMYEKGDGVKPDIKKALKCYEAAQNWENCRYDNFGFLEKLIKRIRHL